MKTITISDETADFISKLAHTIETQDNRFTATPIFFTIEKMVNVHVPEGCGDNIEYYRDGDTYTEEEIKGEAKDADIDFDDYVDLEFSKFNVREEPRYEGFFLTKDGYDEHIKRNGHNIGSTCNSFHSYVDHIYRNPEMENVIKSIKEIAIALKQSK